MVPGRTSFDRLRGWPMGGGPRALIHIIGNGLATLLSLLNAFVHSRDAYAVMPEGLWLSWLTIILLVLAKVLPALQHVPARARS